MTDNRKLGVYIADPAASQALYTTITADYAGGTVYCAAAGVAFNCSTSPR